MTPCYKMKKDTSKKRIFVQMVSYRDPECHPTLRDLFEKAAHPERISVGLCWQYDPEEDAECFAENYPRQEQVRVLQYHIMDAGGAGWARQQAQTLWAGEEYTLQIQAHMRFDPGWDETLIEMLTEIPKRAVLTGWLPNYDPPDAIQPMKDWFQVTSVNSLAKEGDAQLVHLVKHGLRPDHVPKKPMLTATWVGNFMFARSAVFKEVPFDPHIFFWGEEINYSARLWTHGYDMYHVNRPVMYHHWNRRAAKDAREYRDHNEQRNRLSLMRNRHVLGLGAATDQEALIDIGKYSLGSARSLSDYFTFYGIDFITRTVQPHARQGLWHAPEKALQVENVQPRIFVAIASYRDPELSATVKDLFDKAAQPDLIRIGICLQRDPHTEEQCGIITDRRQQVGLLELDYRHSPGANWARVQALSMRKEEDYVLMVDSHMRFTQGWDDTLIEMLARCPAEKPVLSAYLPNYNPPDERMQHPGHLLRVRVRRLGEGEDAQLVHVTGTFAPLNDAKRSGLYSSPFVVGNFIFSRRVMVEEIPIDPYFAFYGDEISYGARLWTHGYDVFQPDQVVLYHYWVRKEHLPIQEYRMPHTGKSRLSWLRGRHLLGLAPCDDPAALQEIEQYGLGNERALAGLWAFAGVDWAAGTVTDEAQQGWWDLAERDKALKQSPRKASQKLPRIFVQIASYRDPDCQNTVKDLFEKAAHPERIFVGICWQFIKEEDQDCFEIPYPRPKQVRVHDVNAYESRGVCWARNHVQKLWQGEEYTLQIDSHMRCEPHWDEKLLETWQACENDKAILTCYPPGFTPPNKLQKDWIHGMGADQFDAHGILLMRGRPRFSTKSLPEKPLPGVFLSGCMFFGPASIIKEVPYDPHLYFFGEEILMAVRLWTHGYDLYHPHMPILYHDWDRKKRTTHFDDHKDWGKLNDKSFARVRHLLGVETSEDSAVLEEINLYGLGKTRSLAQYEAYSGVDFANKTFTKDAHDGIFGDRKAKQALIHMVEKNNRPKIFVQIASYRDSECQWTVKDLFEKATYPDRISVGICWQFDPEEDGDCFKVTTRPEQVKMLPYDWREGEGVCWARRQTQQLWEGEEYTLQIDSHMRFVPGWDEYLIAELAACPSEKAVISCSPASYTPPNDLQKNPKPTIRRVQPFFPDGNIRGKGEYIDHVPEKPLPGAFIAAGFMFSKGDVIKEVPYDPYLYFDQEEISYAARLYTHGWDIFSSRQPFLYHYYNTKESVRPLHWRDVHTEDKKRIAFLRQRGMDRFNHLVGYQQTKDEKIIKELNKYGFGSVRSLQDYEAYSGVDFKHKVASERALRCQFIPDLGKYRDTPIIVPEIDNATKPAQQAMPVMNDNKKTEAKKSEAPKVDEPLALTTLNPLIRMDKPYRPKSMLLEPCDFAPFVESRDEEDKRRALEVLAGRHVLVTFLSSKDRDYARQFFTTLNTQFKPHGKLEIWHVCITDTTVEKLAALKKDFHINSAIWQDPGSHLAAAFGLDTSKGTPPASFLLNRNLKIINRHVGLKADQLATHIANDLLNALKLDKLAQGDPQIVTQMAPALIVPDALPPEFCDYCIDTFRKGHTFDGTVGAEKNMALRTDAKVRTDHVVHGKLLDELDEKLSRSLFPEIRKVFGFDVTYRELYKIGLYKGEKGGFFKAHRDNFDNPLGYRRVAMTLHLSDDYEGGGLRFPEYGNTIYRPKKGAAIAFSSASLHEAMPVTAGERFVIVGFFHGDQDEAYRRHYLSAKQSPLKIKDYTPTLRNYPGVTISRDFYKDWQKEEVAYNVSQGGKPAAPSSGFKPVPIPTKSGHTPKKVFESKQAVIIDDFLPADVYERLQQHALKADYEYLNTQKISRAWHVHDGFPMRSKKSLFYYARGHTKVPQGDHVYPTKTELDGFADALLEVHPQVQQLIGEENKDWFHFSVNGWIYPPKTGLSIHDDGSGIYSGAYVYFLNPTWRPHWGGVLVMLDEESNRLAFTERGKGDQHDFYKLKYFHANQLDETIMQHGLGTAIFPKGNRIVFIASDAYHMITRVNETAGDNLRMSLAGFYNRKSE